MFEETVLAIIRRAVKSHADPKSATEQAEREIYGLAAYDTIVAELVTTAVRELVYRERARINTALKSRAGEYGQPAKVRVGQSRTVNNACESYYSYCIGSSTLGLLTGAEMMPLAEQEEAQANGHLFNARLLRSLHELVPSNRQVRQVLSERKLRNLFERLRRETGGPNEAA